MRWNMAMADDGRDGVSVSAMVVPSWAGRWSTLALSLTLLWRLKEQLFVFKLSVQLFFLGI